MWAGVSGVEQERDYGLYQSDSEVAGLREFFRRFFPGFRVPGRHRVVQESQGVPVRDGVEREEGEVTVRCLRNSASC